VRQAEGRIDRIGQLLETRIYYPIYSDTLQQNLYDLLMKKVAVAVSTDGLDNESVLLASGASDAGYLTGLSIGRQLWAMING
jgi:SNF2 family DNA or RNA helicase